MKLYYFILSFICFCSVACTDTEYDNQYIDDKIYIEGITYSINSSRGNIITKTSFDNGDSILFNSFGSHTNKNNILSFNGSTWKCNKMLKWNTASNDSIHYAAFYPASSNYLFTKNEIYKHGELQDITFCLSSKKYKEKLDLNFNHIFSLLKINLNNNSNSNITSITISVPVTVDSIGILNGKIYTSNQTVNYTDSVSSDNSCSFIIPAIKDLSVSFNLNSSGDTIKKYIRALTYEPGKIYTCNVTLPNNTNCINNAEDFVAFTHLINNKAYGNRSLEEFYYIKDNKRVYSLGNDISFTEEQCNNMMVAHKYKVEFNDIFDGKGHSLSNIKVNVNSNSVALFGYIGESGVVKNLRIKNSDIISLSKKEGALLAYRNYGEIDNCIIDSCTLESAESSGICLLAFYVSGRIINSMVTNSIINCGKNSGNCIFTKILYGKIINCCSANNEFIPNTASYESGLILSAYDYSEIRNCYVKCKFNQTNKVYQYCYATENSVIIDNCFGSEYIPAWPKVQPSSNIYIYDNELKEINSRKNVIDMLNSWIDEKGSLYPNYTFRKWKNHTNDVPYIHIQ